MAARKTAKKTKTSKVPRARKSAPAEATAGPGEENIFSATGASEAASQAGLRNRITGTRWLEGREIQESLHRHPLNPKIHDDVQRRAMRGVLNEIGIAGVFMAREDRTTGELHMYDGHLRQDEIPRLDPAAKVLVVVTDLSEEEADKAILTYDFLTGLSQPDPDHLKALLERVPKFNAEELGSVQEDLAILAGLRMQTTNLDDLKKKHGDGDLRDFWPVVRLLVPPLTKEYYDALMARATGKDDAEKFQAILEAADEVLPGSGEG